MAASIIYKGGLPYGPDVARLKEAFPLDQLAEGRVISHDEIAKVLAIAKYTSRYYGVLNSWIAHHRAETGKVMVWEPSRGIKVLNPAEILEYAETRTRQKIRQTGRAIRTFGWVDRNRLDEVGQRRLDHQMRVANALKDALDSSKKKLTVELAPVQSLPKPSLVKSA